MGGSALNSQGVFTERKNTEDFLRIGNEIQANVFDSLGLKSSMVRCYHSKTDHGDLDLLVQLPMYDFTVGENFDYPGWITKTFKPQAIHTNANVHSFDYQNFQIDFIKICNESWDTARIYYSYDPLGNIMGKSYHKFGLSYGWDGLYYKFRNFNGKNSQDILISTDPEKIFAFGDYDYQRYLQGFETLEEIYDFCINSKYFNFDTFKMENLTQIDRKRNRKRKSYAAFLEYVNAKNIDKTFNFNTKESYISMVDEYFPEAGLIKKLEVLKADDELNRLAAEKFNGNIIMEWMPELQGKELGAAISKFKENCGGDYRTYIINTDINDIKEVFTDLMQESL